MDITILNAELCTNHQTEAWFLAVEVTEDGATSLHAVIIPIDALEWRVAEFGLDDMSDAELWELLVRENFTQLPASTDPDGLANADTVEQARDTYLARISKRKGTGTLKRGAAARRSKPLKAAGPGTIVLADSDGGDAFTLITERSPRRPEHIEARREIVTRTREETRIARLRSSSESRDEIVLAEARRIRARKAAD